MMFKGRNIQSIYNLYYFFNVYYMCLFIFAKDKTQFLCPESVDKFALNFKTYWLTEDIHA